MATALSIRQPWVELILQGRKTIEVRTWNTNYRGRLLLHASRAVDCDACNRFGLEPSGLTIGAIVGVVDLTDCRRFTYEDWQELFPAHLNLRDFRKGLIGWFLRNPRRVAPTPLPGRLGLFVVPGYDVSATITRFSVDLAHSGKQMEATSHLRLRSQ